MGESVGWGGDAACFRALKEFRPPAEGAAEEIEWSFLSLLSTVHTVPFLLVSWWVGGDDPTMATKSSQANQNA